MQGRQQSRTKQILTDLATEAITNLNSAVAVMTYGEGFTSQSSLMRNSDDIATVIDGLSSPQTAQSNLVGATIPAVAFIQQSTLETEVNNLLIVAAQGVSDVENIAQSASIFSEAARLGVLASRSIISVNPVSNAALAEFEQLTGDPAKLYTGSFPDSVSSFLEFEYPCCK